MRPILPYTSHKIPPKTQAFVRPSPNPVFGDCQEYTLSAEDQARIIKVLTRQGHVRVNANNIKRAPTYWLDFQDQEKAGQFLRTFIPAALGLSNTLITVVPAKLIFDPQEDFRFAFNTVDIPIQFPRFPGKTFNYKIWGDVVPFSNKNAAIVWQRGIQDNKAYNWVFAFADR